MIQSKREYLEQLNKELRNHPGKQEIIQDYEHHISELMLELSRGQLDEEEVIKQVLVQLGTPAEIAVSWQEELSVTPVKTQWLFIIANLLFFIAGTLLTVIHNMVEWSWVDILWESLTSIPSLIIVMYLIFWALLGYEIGKSFGHGGRNLMQKTFVLSLLPNVVLMNLTLFNIIPHDWFYPLLNQHFIVKCVVFTLLLYPVCWAGYRWGKYESV
ncbi:HAAS signaling domain-containing protein [Mesobacillus harenae]|uniref:HAAS signaling domain-containing protein n=1 Tax=Mesobacillus harenae TaxID=2213203 RepID=UPI00158037BA|nr:hypothetical protein [Mesobacillus harenae]